MNARSGLLQVMLRAAMTLMALATLSCAGKDDAQDPVSGGEAPPAVPDAPGDGGESAEKPAGEGMANGESGEKSQSNMDAATGAMDTTGGGEMVVTAGALNVRKGPGMKHETVRTLKMGEKVTAQSCKNGWCQIGEQEFAASKFLGQGADK